MARVSKRDYYEVLGLSKNASAAEIKSAYRRLAREHHPDMVAESDKKTAEEKFKEINEAYQVLSDPQKKQMYDQYGHAASGFSGSGSGPFGSQGFGTSGTWGPFSYSYTSSNANFSDFDPFDIFAEVFGSRGYRQPSKGKNLFYEMHIEFSDAVFGLEKKIKVESGEVKIKIPKGVNDGTELRFAGKGMPGPNNLPNGDLYITVRVPLPKEFLERSGDTLGVISKINFVDAILGTEIEVPIIDTSEPSGIGKARLKIPPGTQHNTNFKIRNKGMPSLQKETFGDVVVKVLVEIPTKISGKQKKLLEEYRASR